MERTAYERELEARVAELENSQRLAEENATRLAQEVIDLETAQEERVRLLLLAVDGRREYALDADTVMSTMSMAQLLNAEADTLTSALKIVLGDPSPLYAMLPSWRWGEAGLS